MRVRQSLRRPQLMDYHAHVPRQYEHERVHHRVLRDGRLFISSRFQSTKS